MGRAGSADRPPRCHLSPVVVGEAGRRVFYVWGLGEVGGACLDQMGWEGGP